MPPRQKRTKPAPEPEETDEPVGGLREPGTLHELMADWFNETYDADVTPLQCLIFTSKRNEFRRSDEYAAYRDELDKTRAAAAEEAEAAPKRRRKAAADEDEEEPAPKARRGRKAKAAEPEDEDEPEAKPAPKRRGRPAAKDADAAAKPVRRRRARGAAAADAEGDEPF